MGILIGMVETETNPEIREISVKACHDSLGFMEALIQRNVSFRENTIILHYLID